MGRIGKRLLNSIIITFGGKINEKDFSDWTFGFD